MMKNMSARLDTMMTRVEKLRPHLIEQTTQIKPGERIRKLVEGQVRIKPLEKVGPTPSYKEEKIKVV